VEEAASGCPCAEQWTRRRRRERWVRDELVMMAEEDGGKVEERCPIT